MPIEFSCINCSHRMRAPDTSAGKRVKCPKCQTVVGVPGRATAASDSSPPSGSSSSPDMGVKKWFVKLSDDGETYGPVDKAELDQWVGEGRITEQTQILLEGSEQWKWAPEIFPQLQKQAPASGPATSGGIPQMGISGASSGGMLSIDTGDSSPSGITYRRRNYPAMLVASKMYYIFGWVMMALGILGVGGYLVAGLMGAVAMFDRGQAGAGIAALLATFLTSAILAVYTAIVVITLWFMAEAIKAMMDVEDNTHKTNHLLQQLVAKGTT